MEDVLRLSFTNLNSPETRGSVISLRLTDTFQLQHDEYTWSWSFLQSQFNTREKRSSFEKYRSRIRHSNFVLVLLLSIIHSIIQVSRAQISQLTYSYSTLYFPVFSSGVSVVLLAWSFDEKRFHKHRLVPMATSAGICLLLLLEEYGALLTDCYRTGQCGHLTPRIGSATYLILLIYFLPQLKIRYCTIAFGFTVVIMEALFSIWFLKMPFMEFLPDLGTYIFLNVIGIIKQFVDEITQRRSFLDLRDTIDYKQKLELEEKKEERFLLTIIPKHFVPSLKTAVRAELSSLNSHALSKSRAFSKLFIMSYDNIRPICQEEFDKEDDFQPLQNSALSTKKFILFSDIVNFTPLTEMLEVSELINTLNELFGGFDKVTEKNQCTRIKILGDCYYCISGLPEKSETQDFETITSSIQRNNDRHGQHAVNCVLTGLGIMEIIRDVRDRLRVPLDMRVGIHSGYIHCGLLGLLKWQYDIWSRDVTIANILEQTGTAGRVHISEVTKNLLKNKFETDPAYGSMSHPYLHNMETFFIRNPIPQEEHDGGRRYSTAVGNQYRRGSVAPIMKKVEIMQKANPDPSVYRVSSSVDESVQEFNKLKKGVDEELDKAIEDMAFSKREQWLGDTEINPVLLTYDECNQEPPFLQQTDPIFKHNLTCAFVLYVGIIFVAYFGFWPSKQVGHLSLTSYPIAIGSAAIMLFFIIVIYLAWHNFFKRKIKVGSSTAESSTDQPTSYLPWLSGNLQKVSNSLQSNFWIRTIIFFIVSSSILTWLTFSSLNCVTNITGNASQAVNKSAEILTTVVSNDALSRHHNRSINATGFKPDQTVWIQPRVITYSYALYLVIVSVFMRTHYMLKFVLKGIALGLFTAFAHEIWRTKPNFLWESRFVHDPAKQNWSSAYIDHILFLTFIFIVLHLEDRQLEYFGRLDYLWKCKVKEEEEEAGRTEHVNHFLLGNILPQHVIDKYRNNQSTNELHQNVAVMFASIPNFTDFYSENDMNVKGLKCLQLLNEIINNFDRLLLQGGGFERIEKMKMVGSTFMAAVGLRTERGTSRPNDHHGPIDDPIRNTVLLVEFATRMMEKLDQLNKDSLQDFRLRIGIDCGTVIAGIVGDHKPLYDIWGNTVNVSSRMDTTGVLGRIQVTEKCAQYLMKNEFECEYRGEIYVKGKGNLKTYFVKTEYDKREEVSHL